MNHFRVINTLNTTRVCGGNTFQNAVSISDIVYADKAPDSIILVNGQIYQDGFVATSLIHFPRNAPILFTNMNYLDSQTLNQIMKLNPKGVNGIQIFIVGGISYHIDQQLIRLGFRIKRISGTNFWDTAALVAEYLHYPERIMIVSGEAYWDGLSACAWAAHMGDPILLTAKNELPPSTRSIIQRTKNPNVFIMGNTRTISKKVEEEISGLNVNFIDRIGGETPFEVAINFSKYKSPDNKFGWGRTDREGHAFTFTAVENPFDSVSGSLFAHLGKHSPILVVSKNKFPQVTHDYIESVKPLPLPEPHPPFMHGWVIGCEETISSIVQLEIERSLSIDEYHVHG